MRPASGVSGVRTVAQPTVTPLDREAGSAAARQNRSVSYIFEVDGETVWSPGASSRSELRGLHRNAEQVGWSPNWVRMERVGSRDDRRRGIRGLRPATPLCYERPPAP